MRESTEFQTALTGKGGIFGKYKVLTVGEGSLFFLLKYELLTTMFGSLPGAAGFFFRKIFYRFLFKKMGKRVVLGKGLTIRNPQKISLGHSVIIDDYCVLDAKGDEKSSITVADNVIISRNVVLSCKGGKIEIGDNTNIGAFCLVHSENSVELGKNILIAAYTYLVGGGNHDFSRRDLPIMSQPSLNLGGIVIGGNVWLGARVTVLDGVTVGEGTVVGAAALVNKDLPQFIVATGVPARVIRKR